MSDEALCGTFVIGFELITGGPHLQKKRVHNFYFYFLSCIFYFHPKGKPFHSCIFLLPFCVLVVLLRDTRVKRAKKKRGFFRENVPQRVREFLLLLLHTGILHFAEFSFFLPRLSVSFCLICLI